MMLRNEELGQLPLVGDVAELGPSSGCAGRDCARPGHRGDDDHRGDIRGKRDDADVEVADRLRQGGEQRARIPAKAPAGVVGLCGIRLVTTAGKSWVTKL